MRLRTWITKPSQKITS